MLVNLLYVVSYVCLTLHLLFIPIQIAYFWLIVDIDVQHRTSVERVRADHHRLHCARLFLPAHGALCRREDVRVDEKSLLSVDLQVSHSGVRL